ncbi:MAG: TonB-dependent receptor, partial [Bacteroidetes bacterium]|nr:TonB-dependent receptor [Bacteroidota bacterium]
DGVSRKGVEYATVTIYQTGNAKPVNGGTTNDKGAFSIAGLAMGQYYIVVEYIGHDSRQIDSVLLSEKSPVYNAGDIVLVKKDQVLQGVVVTAQRGLVENKIDKMVYNAEKDVTSQGGVATDVLKKVPMVSVDVDGNVQLQGNSSVRFLINGKPSSIFGNSITDALASIPAGQIKSIEVITSPGARYDAEGSGGIINIILKDSGVRGINGNINLSAGSRLENGSMNLNFRRNNFGIHGFFSGNAQLRSTTINELDRSTFDSSGKMTGHQLQDGQSRFARNGFETGIGFDWTIDKKSSITGGISLDNFGNNGTSTTNQQQLYYTNGALVNNQHSIRYSGSRFRGQSIDWNLNYKKVFREDQELEISFESGNGTNKSSYSQYLNPLSSDSILSGSNGSSNGVDKSNSLTLDYTQPLTEKLKMEA